MFKSSQLLSIAGAALIVFCLGLWGFHRADADPELRAKCVTEHPKNTEEHCKVSLINEVGFTLGLFLRDTSRLQVIERPPLQLTAARYLAPWVTLFSTLLGALAIAVANLRHDFRVARARKKVGHIIVCGLGDIGLTIVQNLRDPNLDKPYDVVAIDLDGDSEHAATAGQAGATIIKGNGKEHSVMRAAGVAGARCVIICAGDDARNVDIALGLRSHAAGHHLARRTGWITFIAGRVRARVARDTSRQAGTLLILVELRDEWLFGRLIDHDTDPLGTDAVEIRFFNTYQNTARLLLQRMPAPRASGDTAKPTVIIGFGSAGKELATQLIQTAFAPLGQPVRLTVFDKAADAAEQKFAATVALIPDFAEVAFEECTLVFDTAASWESVRNYLKEHGAAAVVVCLSDDTMSLYVAVELRAYLDTIGQRDTPIYFRLGQHTSLGEFIGHTELQQDRLDRLVPFGAFPAILDADILVDETLDHLAKAIHEIYRQSLTDEQRLNDPQGQEWGGLAEQYKMSNRRAADFLRIRLAQAGLSVTEPKNRAVKPHNFSDEELKLLLALEHRRWRIERLVQGWTYGKCRDNLLKTNPLLVEWDSLPETVRQRQRNDLVDLLGTLTRFGWEVARPEEPAAV